jgi:hypothetical protein
MYRPQPLLCASREDSNWEPHGVPHLVRSYEGSVTYRCADTILSHRRETRRQTENTNCVLARREKPTYSPNLLVRLWRGPRASNRLGLLDTVSTGRTAG